METCEFRQVCFEAHLEAGTIKEGHLRDLDNAADITGYVCGFIIAGTVQHCPKWLRYSENNSVQTDGGEET